MAENMKRLHIVSKHEVRNYVQDAPKSKPLPNYKKIILNRIK